MGTEMIIRATDSFERKQRRSLEQLEEPNLFTMAPRLVNALLATPQDGHVFAVGEEYRLTLVDSDLLVVRGVCPVGIVKNPPESVLDMMRGPVPSAQGRVTSVSSMSGDAELTLGVGDEAR